MHRLGGVFLEQHRAGFVIDDDGLARRGLDGLGGRGEQQRREGDQAAKARSRKAKSRGHVISCSLAAPDRHGDAEICRIRDARSEEHTSELQSLMRISYAVYCLKKKKTTHRIIRYN